MKINSVEDLVKASLPLSVMTDINSRIRDWLASGGNINDEYIKQQFRYAENILSRVG
ncbi:MAG: hypothetical protein E6713_06140 [Sporomusaceae bacterium]|nr:hypothetical protein [Sporomusaceae bacterium]